MIAKHGHLYAIRAADGTGPTKIGHSGNPERRLAQIQAHSPVRLELVGYTPASWNVEQTIHGLLSDERLHGEWFSGPCTDVVLGCLRDPVTFYNEHYVKKQRAAA